MLDPTPSPAPPSFALPRPRLVDQVAAATRPVVIVDGAARRRMPGSAARAAAVRTCPLRYVLADEVTAACRDRAGGLDATIRLPARSCWVEWTESDGRRTGVLASGDDDGVRGALEVFWEQAAGEPDRAQLRLRLDLAHCLAAEADGHRLFALDPSTHPLAPHLLFELDHVWAPHFFHAGPAAALHGIRAAAADVRDAADILFAFARLLATPAALTGVVAAGDRRLPRPVSDRAASAGAIEVRLTLGAAGSDRPAVGSGVGRSPSRLHQVRGHYVQRAGRIFWRRAHARGALETAITTRTTSVALHRPAPAEYSGMPLG